MHVSVHTACMHPTSNHLPDQPTRVVLQEDGAAGGKSKGGAAKDKGKAGKGRVVDMSAHSQANIRSFVEGGAKQGEDAQVR